MHVNRLYKITCSLPNWQRIIKTNSNLTYAYFEKRLSGFSFQEIFYTCVYDCYIETVQGQKDQVNFWDEYNHKKYTELNLSSSFSLFCLLFVNIKKEKDSLQAWILHAAGFTYGDSLCLLGGSTHSGKSTTMSHLLYNNKIQYLNDDVTIFDTDTAQIIPFYKPLQLRGCIPRVSSQKFAVDYFQNCDTNVTTISPLNYTHSNNSRLSFNKIMYFLLVRDNQSAFAIHKMDEKQKYLSLLFNCYDDNIQRNVKTTTALLPQMDGYQITFADGTDVANKIIDILKTSVQLSCTTT